MNEIRERGCDDEVKKMERNDIETGELGKDMLKEGSRQLVIKGKEEERKRLI